MKPSHLITFDEKRKPQEHLVSINTKMIIIEAYEALEYKFISSTLKKETLGSYMSLARHSITRYSYFSHNFFPSFIMKQTSK